MDNGLGVGWNLTSSGSDDFERLFRKIAGKRPDELMTTADSLLISYRTRIVDFAVKHRLPSMYPSREFVLSGGLMFYGGSHFAEMFQPGRGLRGRDPQGARSRADLPVGPSPATAFELVINLKTSERP